MYGVNLSNSNDLAMGTLFNTGYVIGVICLINRTIKIS